MKAKLEEIKNKIIYRFNECLTRGAVVQFIMLILSVLVVVAIFGLIIGLFVEGESTFMGMWSSLMHILDQGTLGGDDVGDKTYIVIMTIVTVIGMLFMGTIIGIMDNALGDYLDKLKSGQSKVMEEQHLLIMGFDDNIHSIISEQMAANENWEGNRSIVILDGDMDIDQMRTEVFERIDPDKEPDEPGKKVKKSKLIYRKGNMVSPAVLDMVSADKAKAIIINCEDDFDVIKVVLALTRFLKGKGIYKTDAMPNIVTMMHNEDNVSAAKVAALVDEKAFEKIQIMYFGDILSRIFAQVCRQPGLSKVIAELFTYDKSEIYIEDSCNGKSLEDLGIIGRNFGEVIQLVTASIPIGVKKKSGEILLNPDSSLIIEKGDSLVHVAMDDNELETDLTQSILPKGNAGYDFEKEENPYKILIFGWNEPLPLIIDNIAEFAPAGSRIEITSEIENCKVDQIKYYENLTVEYNYESPYDWNNIRKYLDMKIADGITNIILLCPDDIEIEDADKKTAVLLLNVRSYIEKLAKNESDEEKKKQIEGINITSEMNLAEDQGLLQDTNINDFVVGSEIANRMMVQVANNPSMYRVFREILSDEGSEIYLRDIEDYVDINNSFNWQYVARQARNKDEVAIGWIKYDEKKRTTMRINPLGAPKCIEYHKGDFNESDKLIVIAED